MFPYRPSQRDHCLRCSRPSFALPLNPSLKRIYNLPPLYSLFLLLFCLLLIMLSILWIGPANGMC
jgi:hypothetical protein